MNNIIIVTRHSGLVEWLRNRGIVGITLSHVEEKDVRGQHVIGALPLHLAAIAASVTTVDMPLLRPDQRGQDLSPCDMDSAGAVLRTYQVGAGLTTPIYQGCNYPDVGEVSGNFVATEVIPPSDCGSGYVLWELNLTPLPPPPPPPPGQVWATCPHCGTVPVYPEMPQCQGCGYDYPQWA